jgi:hypothetical protein
MYITFLNLPSEAKALDFQGLPCGTAKAVPFQNMDLLIFHVHAIALKTVQTTAPSATKREYTGAEPREQKGGFWPVGSYLLSLQAMRVGRPNCIPAGQALLEVRQVQAGVQNEVTFRRP